VSEETLGQRVRRLRLARGLSQEELAHQAGVSKTQVYLVENGTTRSPQGEVLRGYARALDISLSYLTTGVDDTAPTNSEAWPPLEVYLRHTLTLSDEEIAQIVRIVRALEMEQQRELALQERGHAQS